MQGTNRSCKDCTLFSLQVCLQLASTLPINSHALLVCRTCEGSLPTLDLNHEGFMGLGFGVLGCMFTFMEAEKPQ